MKHLTRKAVRVDATASKYIGGEVKIQDIGDKLLNLILNGPTINAINKDVLRHLVRQLYDELQAYEEQERWIPVTERLPDDEKDVWSLCRLVRVLMYDGTESVGYCNRGLRMWFHLPALGTNFVGHNFEKTPVVAWMPLPESVKEVE